MNTILLTFANTTPSLETLREEDREVYQLLSQKASEEKVWHIQHNSNASIRDITDDLDIYKDQIAIFLFSGHAGRDSIEAADQSANAEGIAAMLGQCRNLKLVILNGCSTQGQVANLLAAGVPCVIATSAPIADFSATQFSISFFKAMANKGKNIEKSFEAAVAVAKTYTNNKISPKRGFVKRGERDNTPLWGIFYPEGQEINVEWTLNPTPIADSNFVPNQLLLEKTWEAIAPFVGAADKDFSKLDKIDKIIFELPHPISVYLRKLIAKSRPGEKEEEFYNRLSVKRLKYLLYTYTTCIELLNFTLLAQLWDELAKESIQKIPTNLKESLGELFILPSRDRKGYSVIPIIQQISQLFEKKNIPYFIPEFETICQEIQQDGALHQACLEIETIKKDYLEEEKIPDTVVNQCCIQLEKYLATVLSEMGFFAKYKMKSMKDINFIKYKHQSKPKYKLNFVELRYRAAGMDIDYETLFAYMDNDAVIFQKEVAGKASFLNLSPFIFDQNSFDKKAKLANLCVFKSFEVMAKVFTFRYIYQPQIRPLVVRDDSDYYVTLADQFNAFYELLFNKKLVVYEKAVA